MNHKGKNGLNLGSKDSRKNVQPEMLISALENIPGGFHQCALEEGYPFLYMNERFLEILGWTKEEIEKQFDNKFTNLMADEDRDLVDNFVARILEGSSAKETKRQIYRLKSKNGLIWVSNAINLVREGIIRSYKVLLPILTIMFSNALHTKKNWPIVMPLLPTAIICYRLYRPIIRWCIYAT